MNYYSDGKMKQKVTKEKVRIAIESLKEIGKKPTIDRIRQITGGGNPLIMRFKNEIENEIFTLESKPESIEHKKLVLSQKERIIALETQLDEIKMLLKTETENKTRQLERELEKYKAEYVRQKQIIKIQGDVIKRLRERLKMINPQNGGENKILH